MEWDKFDMFVCVGCCACTLAKSSSCPSSTVIRRTVGKFSHLLTSDASNCLSIPSSFLLKARSGQRCNSLLKCSSNLFIISWACLFVQCPEPPDGWGVEPTTTTGDGTTTTTAKPTTTTGGPTTTTAKPTMTPLPTSPGEKTPMTMNENVDF